MSQAENFKVDSLCEEKMRSFVQKQFFSTIAHFSFISCETDYYILKIDKNKMLKRKKLFKQILMLFSEALFFQAKTGSWKVLLVT